ncbi:pentapeptide repeat-containing protein, partial [Streptomyces sp. SID5926]|nr:pentapeptide repeat-containing protein [Streptomyces sp. SID5926]
MPDVTSGRRKGDFRRPEGDVSGGVQHVPMARRTAGTAGGRGTTTVRAARRPELRLPPLTPFEDDGGLEPDGDYDALDFRETDLTGQDGAGARFMDCALTGC